MLMITDYDHTMEKSWIMYQDKEYTFFFLYHQCINILILFIGNDSYGWAMFQNMPHGGFKWVEHSLNETYDLPDTSNSIVRFQTL